MARKLIKLTNGSDTFKPADRLIDVDYEVHAGDGSDDIRTLVGSAGDRFCGGKNDDTYIADIGASDAANAVRIFEGAGCETDRNITGARIDWKAARGRTGSCSRRPSTRSGPRPTGSWGSTSERS